MMIHGERPAATSRPPAWTTISAALADHGAAMTATGPLPAGTAAVTTSAAPINRALNRILRTEPRGNVLRADHG